MTWWVGRAFYRWHSAGLRTDQIVVLGAPVGLKLERCLLEEHASVEVAVVENQFVVGSLAQGHDLAVRIDDARTGHQITVVLGAGFGHAGHPASVLVRARLHAQMIVVYAVVIVLVAQIAQAYQMEQIG